MRRCMGWSVWFIVLALCVSVAAAQDAAKPEAVGLRPDAPTYALHGPYWVGTREFAIEDSEGKRALPIAVWYPALKEEGAENYAVYDMGISDLVGSEFSLINDGHALADATPNKTDAPYPLVIVSHGLGGSRFGYFRLAEHLASHGFVVIGVEHLGTASRESVKGTANVGNRDTFLSLYYRPQDIKRTIEYADILTANDGPLAGLIDTEHVAVWGHSTGGTTAFQAGGARIDLKALRAWCLSKEGDELAAESCQFVRNSVYLAQLARRFGAENPEAELFPALWDTRVDAIIAAAPGGELHAFGEAGMAAVTIPTLTLVGTDDPYVSPEYNAYWAYDHISSQTRALAAFNGGGHLMFMDCPAAFKKGCGYDAVWDIDRAHDLINHFTTAFLLAVLKGDKNARAALGPNAVTFPGIEYKAEGF